MTQTGRGGLTAELIARAIVAAALAYGDDPVKAMTGTRQARRCVTAATSGAQRATGLPMTVVAKAFSSHANQVHNVRREAKPAFVAAELAARRAVEYAGWRPEACASRKAQAPAGQAQPPAQPRAPSTPEPISETADAAPPAGTAAPPRSPAPAVPRPAEVESPGGTRPDPDPPVRMRPRGRPPLRPRPERVKQLKPITERTVMYAGRFRDAGWPVDEVADLFDVAADGLAEALEAPQAAALSA